MLDADAGFIKNTAAVIARVALLVARGNALKEICGQKSIIDHIRGKERTVARFTQIEKIANELAARIGRNNVRGTVVRTRCKLYTRDQPLIMVYVLGSDPASLQKNVLVSCFAQMANTGQRFKIRDVLHAAYLLFMSNEVVVENMTRAKV